MEKNTEKKKRDGKEIVNFIMSKLLLVALVVALIGGGIWAVKYFGIIGDEDMKVSVETKEVATCWSEDAILETISECDEKYFYVQNNEDGSFIINQTDKTTLIEKTGMSQYNVNAIINDREKGFNKFLNLSYEDIPKRQPGEPEYIGESGLKTESFLRTEIISEDGKTTSPSGLGGIADYEKINSVFGGDIDEYFKNNELDLECEAVEITKIAVVKTITTVAVYDSTGEEFLGNEEEEIFIWYYVTEADVTTVNCTDDADLLGIYAPKGETKKVTLLSSYEMFNDYECSSLYIK